MVEQVQVLRDDVERDDRADDWEHLRGDEEEQHVAPFSHRADRECVGGGEREGEHDQGRCHADRDRVLEVGAQAPVPYRGVFVEGRREDEVRRARGRVLLVFEPGQGHPEDREEERQHDDPGEDAEDEPARQPAPVAGSCRVRCGHRPAIPSSLNRLEIRRRASVATMMVAMTTTTPIADARPMSKPRKATS